MHLQFLMEICFFKQKRLFSACARTEFYKQSNFNYFSLSLSDSCSKELQRSEAGTENKFVLVAVLVDKEKL